MQVLYADTTLYQNARHYTPAAAGTALAGRMRVALCTGTRGAERVTTTHPAASPPGVCDTRDLTTKPERHPSALGPKSGVEVGVSNQN